MKNTLPQNLWYFTWHFLKEYKVFVTLLVSLAVLAGFWGPFNSMLVKNIIDRLPYIQNGDTGVLIFPASLIIVNFIIFDNFTWRGITYLRAKFMPIIINRIIGELTAYVLGKSHQFFQDSLSGKIAKQITNLADGLERLITNVVVNFLRGASLLLMAFVAAYFASPIFSFILVVWFALFAGISIVMSKKLVELGDKQAKIESTIVGELVDSLSNQSNVRIFARKAYEKLRLGPFLNKQQTAYRDTYFYSLIMHSIQGGLIAIMMAFSCYFLVYLYSKNLVTIGDFALIMGLSMETGHMMWFTMSVVDEFNKEVGKCKQSLTTLLMPIEIEDKQNATELIINKGKITFDKVKFHYKGTSSLFEDKSVTIEAGQKVGLVGYSGSGKSSFVSLILRLYDVTDGRILIDNQDISDVTQDSLRSHIALIPQDPSLFHRSLMENIRYGLIDATDDDVIEAAKRAHAHEFINKLPEKYESLVGERGVKLSGGQRQRIAIARAILKNAPILILDEATSQLDSVTENDIQDSLSHLMKNKTTIVVAHRLSTLLHMDRILVFDKGKIMEDGSHKELLALKGLYKTLWEAQVGGFLPEVRE
jgi:ATP-binding cassette subfamily B protein